MKTTLTTQAQPVSRIALKWWEQLYLPSIIKGMLITLKHLFKKSATINYPEQQRPFSPVFRGLHILNRDEENRERCTACGLCALACPAEAITMEAAERTPENKHLYREEKYAEKYEINLLRCIFCGMCEEACPKEAIFLTQTVPAANYKRERFIATKKDMLIPLDTHKKKCC